MTTKEQRDFWSGPVGETWARLSAALAMHHAAITDEILRRADVVPGDRVLEVGAGDGTLSARLAARGARILAVDLSPPLVALHRARGTPGVRVAELDAESHAFEAGRADLVVSQFGVMFFADSRAAFANLHRAAAPGGRLLFAAWAGPEHNPWFDVPARIAAGMFGPGPSDPDGPGPMRFRDGAAVVAMLAQAGWRAARSEPVDLHLTPPGGREGAADLATRLGGASAALRRGGHGEVERLRLRDRLHDWLGAYAAGGAVRVPARVNIVTARA